jgi:hypothetical protein
MTRLISPAEWRALRVRAAAVCHAAAETRAEARDLREDDFHAELRERAREIRVARENGVRPPLRS